MRAQLLFLLASLAFLPGCLQDAWGGAPASQAGLAPLSLAEIERRLSQPVYEQILYEEATVEGANGTHLWLDIYRPGDAEDAVPVLLYMTPYRNVADAPTSCAEVPPERCAYYPAFVSYFVPRGYAVAFADVRGTHGSGGCMDVVGPDSWRDGYNLVEWLASQPWSAGRVGMYGGSYDGTMTIGTAILNPPHLVTIVPVSSMTSQYSYFNYDGVPYYLKGPQIMAQYLAYGAPPASSPGPVAATPERLPCQPQNFEAGLDRSGDWNGYWDARDFRPHAPGIRASVLQVHGLRDTNVRPDHLDGFWNNLTSEKRLIVGQWGHDFPDRPDWELIQHRWLDHYLKDIDTGILQDLPPVLIEDDTGNWRGIDSFPPKEAETVTFYLSAEGSLTPSPAGSGTLALRDYPRSSNEEPSGALISALGGQATGTPGSLRFQTEPLEKDLHVTGRPLVHLVASTDAKSTHWAVRLADDQAESRILFPDPENGIFNRGFLDTRHRLGIMSPQDLTPGEDYAATLRLYPKDGIIPKGHRLVLTLNNNDDWVHQDTTYATSVVHVGPEGTKLILPLAAAGVPVPEDALRPDLRS